MPECEPNVLLDSSICFKSKFMQYVQDIFLYDCVCVCVCVCVHVCVCVCVLFSILLQRGPARR